MIESLEFIQIGGIGPWCGVVDQLKIGIHLHSVKATALHTSTTSFSITSSLEDSFHFMCRLSPLRSLTTALLLCTGNVSETSSDDVEMMFKEDWFRGHVSVEELGVSGGDVDGRRAMGFVVEGGDEVDQAIVNLLRWDDGAIDHRAQRCLHVWSPWRTNRTGGGNVEEA